MKRTAMTAGLLSSALIIPLAAESRADVRVGVGIQVGSGYRDSGGSWRHGYARGADEGFREGERDARKHERFGYYDERSYRDCDRGYKGWMGPRSVYERAYRQGYGEGYARGYRSLARYQRNDRYYGRDDRDYRNGPRWRE
jgi:hypothetical protein